MTNDENNSIMAKKLRNREEKNCQLKNLFRAKYNSNPKCEVVCSLMRESTEFMTKKIYNTDQGIITQQIFNNEYKKHFGYIVIGSAIFVHDVTLILPYGSYNFRK